MKLFRVYLNILSICIALNGFSQNLVKLYNNESSKVLGGVSNHKEFYGRTDVKINCNKEIVFCAVIHRIANGRELVINDYKFIGFYKDSLITLLNKAGDIVLYNTVLNKEVDFLASSIGDDFFYNSRVKQIGSSIHYVLSDTLYTLNIISKTTKISFSLPHFLKGTTLIDYVFVENDLVILIRNGKRNEVVLANDSGCKVLYSFAVTNLTYDPVIDVLPNSSLLIAYIDSEKNGELFSFNKTNSLIEWKLSLGEFIPINMHIINNFVYFTLFSERERLEYANHNSSKENLGVLLMGANIYKMELK